MTARRRPGRGSPTAVALVALFVLAGAVGAAGSQPAPTTGASPARTELLGSAAPAAGEGLVETELQALLEDTGTELRASLPALVRAPARLDSTLTRLERGDIVVRTEPVDSRYRGDPHLGFAVVAGALVVAAAVLTVSSHPGDLAVAGLAAVLFAVYLVRRWRD